MFCFLTLLMTPSEILTSSSKKKISYYSSCIRMIKYLDMNLHRLELKDIMLSITSKIIQALLVLEAGCFPRGVHYGQEQGSQGAPEQPQPQASGTSMGMGMGQG